MRFRRGAGGTVRVDGVLCSAPVWLRWDGDTLWLVGSGASPVGDDHIRVRVDVGAGIAVKVRSVAATVVYAARGHGTRWDTHIRVGAGSRLDWRTEPLILTEHARHAATTTVAAEADSSVLLDDVVVLGRSAEPAGSLRSTLSARIGDQPVLLTSTDTSLPGWSGPGGTAGARVLANRLYLAADHEQPVPEPGAIRQSSRAALLTAGVGCRLAVAAGDDVPTARSGLDAVLPT